MKNDFLNISINGPFANSNEAEELLDRPCNAYANKKHKKIPQAYSLNNGESTFENYEKEPSCLSFVQQDFYQASFVVSNFPEEEFFEEDDNVSHVEVA